MFSPGGVKTCGLVVALSLATLAVGCGAGSAERTLFERGTEGEEPAVTEVAAAGVRPEATSGVTPGGETEGSSSGAPFVADPEASGGSGRGADGILAVRFGMHEDYERVVLDLGTGREPAGTVPEWTLLSSAGDGLLRVSLPSVSATGVSDGSFGGSLLEDFYVVRAPEGGMFVDVLARETFTYRVLELEDPARLVIDFKPSGAPLEVPLPAEGGDTVLIEPRPGSRVDGTLTVSGYSRNPEASNSIVLMDSGDDVVARETTRSNDWSATWGYFEATLEVPPFAGRGTLRAGAQSARDGDFRGVEIPVKGN